MLASSRRTLEADATWYRTQANRNIAELDRITATPNLESTYGRAYILQLRADIDTFVLLAEEIEEYLANDADADPTVAGDHLF